MKFIILVLLWLSPLVPAQSILLQGGAGQGHPDLPFAPTKPPAATLSLGTAFPEPTSGGAITRTFRIINQDGASLNKLTFSASSSHPAFRVSGLNSGLGPGESDLFQITYRPQGTERVTGLITVTSNDPSRPSYPFEVSGAGGSFAASFVNLAGTELFNSGAEANTPFVGTDTYFGEHPRGSGFVTKQYRIRNTGSLPLEFALLQIAGEGFSFPLGQSSQPLIPAGEEFLFSVRFSTSEVRNGARGVITAASFDLPAVLSFTVEGDAIGVPELALFPLGSSNPVTSSSFGNLELGQSQTKTFLLRNVGEVPLEVSAVELAGDTDDFTLRGLVPGSLGVGEQDSFTLTFNPTAGGTFSASLTITSNDPESPLTFVVSGSGSLPPAPEVFVNGYLGQPGSGTLTAFGFGSPGGSHDIRLGETALEWVAFRNTGAAPASVISVTLSEGFSFTEDLPGVIPAGATIYRMLEFRPARTGRYDLELLLEIAERAEPVAASRSSRALVQERIFDAPVVRIEEVRADQVVLYLPPTQVAGTGAFRLMASSDLVTWESEISDLALNATAARLIGVPKRAGRIFYRIEPATE